MTLLEYITLPSSNSYCVPTSSVMRGCQQVYGEIGL